MAEHPSQVVSLSKPPLASLRERLVQARYQRDWSQQELADLLGTTPLNISRWERGLTTPNPYFRHKLCALFELSEIELGLRPDVVSPPAPDGREAQRESAPLYDPFWPLSTSVPLVGRADLLTRLKSQLNSTRAIALSALHGLPGVGKTALALELAYDAEVRERYPDGLLWAGLGSHPNLPWLLSHWGQLLGIQKDEASRLHSLEAWQHRLRAAIGSRRLLFILDDAWNLEEALACQVGGPQCAYVLTTRLPQLAESFALSAAYTVETLEEEEGLELLRQLAPWAVEQAREQARELVRAVDGLPLALSLIGYTLRQQTHDRQPRRLRAALARLQNKLTRLYLERPQASPGRPADGRRSLEVVIRSGAEQLTEPARQARVALSQGHLDEARCLGTRALLEGIGHVEAAAVRDWLRGLEEHASLIHLSGAGRWGALAGKTLALFSNRCYTSKKGGDLIMSSQTSGVENRSGHISRRKEAIPNTLLRAARHQRGWTQQMLAEQLGTTPLAINRWEQGKAVPGAYFRTRLCELFGVSEEELGLTPRALRAPRPALWLMPHHRNPFFTGRQELLERLHALLHQGKNAALTQSLTLSGLGGIGKTQAVIEYAYRHAHEYTAVFWIHAETLESLVASFASLAELLNLPEKQEADQHKMVAAVSRWLVEQKGWLLILDNVEDIELVRHYLPPARHGSLVFTTRSRAFGGLAQPLEMERMTLEESAQLLLRRARGLVPGTDYAAPLEEPLARSIAELMDGLPLALDQAGAYIEETQCSLADYLQIYQAYPLSLLDERGGRSHHPASVVKTFAMAFEKIQSHNTGAAELLRLCSFLAPDSIPEELITTGAPQLGPVLQGLVANPLHYQAALKDLLAYSLLRRDSETKTITVHRLVQAVIREQLRAEERLEWIGRLLQAFQRVFSYEIMQTARWPKCEQLLPHLLTALNWAESYEQITGDLASLQFTAAIYLRDRGRYDEGEPLLKKAIKIQEEVSAQETLDQARSLKELGVLYVRQGKFEQAEGFLLRSLQIQERIWGPHHLEVAAGLYTLAMLYGNWKNDEEAESLLKRTLAIYEQQSGADHIRAIQTLIALAILCSKEEARYPEAEVLLKQALAMGEHMVDERRDYMIATSLNNLGILYTYQQRYEEAEPLLERALGIWEQELGPEHPYIAEPLGGLADIYKARQAYIEAERYYQQSLRIREQALGEEHPEVALAAYGLADLYRRWGKRELADPLYRQALAIQVRQFGKDHQETVRTLEGYQSFLLESGREEEVTHLLAELATSTSE